MPEDAPPGDKLAWFMNERRLDLGMRWEDVAEIAGITETGLRTLRRTGALPRELTQRGIEKALQWDRGSVRRIHNGGEPASAEPAEITPECEYERRILASAVIDDRAKRLIIEEHRGLGHDWCRPPAQGTGEQRASLQVSRPAAAIAAAG